MDNRTLYLKSIKSLDTEEKIDLFLCRRVGFQIALWGKQWGWHPTTITVLATVFGGVGGALFYWNMSYVALSVGAILFVCSRILDSADGQLARLTKTSSKLGLILDGLSDNAIFLAIYVASTLTVLPQYGWPIFLVAVVAGICHSMQSSALDYYTREYLYFGAGESKKSYWNSTIEEAKEEIVQANPFHKIMLKFHFSWVYQQNKMTTRSDARRMQMRELVHGPHAKAFSEIYRNHNRTLLRWWRLLGANFHIIWIFVFGFLKRFDLYLVFVDIIGLSIAFFILRKVQAAQDNKIYAWIDQTLGKR